MKIFDQFLALPSRFGRITASGTYVPQIDGLRFLAIMPVLLWHSGLRGARSLSSPAPSDLALENLLPHGHIGVELFFFISGFIISFPFLAGRPPGLWSFFKRRLFRLEPPYFIVLVICFLMLSLSRFHPHGAPSFDASKVPLKNSLFASVFYLHGILFNGPSRLDPPVWSLEVEAQFYLICPVILWIYTKILDRKVRILVGTMVVVVSLCAAQMIIGVQGAQSVNRWTLIGHFYPFLMGIVVSDFSIGDDTFNRPGRRIFDLGLLLGLIALGLSGLMEERGYGVPVLVFRDTLRGLGIVCIFFGAARGRLGRTILGAPWIALIGGACYSIYLIHVPLMQIISEVLFRVIQPHTIISAWLYSFLVLIPASIIFGMIFYIFIERPFTMKNWPELLLARLQVVVD